MKTVGDIKNVLVAGAGTLGLRIALRCAMDGYHVVMYDISDQQLHTALEMQASLSKAYLKNGIVDQAMVDRAKKNIIITTNIEQACNNIDLVSESVIENIEIKKQFYRGIAKHLDRDVIVTTNTSYMLPSQLLEVIEQPDHFCALHFHDVFTQTVVDVMPHPGTAIWVNDLLM